MTERHGFELIEEREIREINTRARLYRHARTGAQLLSLENDDENKVFGITFRTPPADSTGIAHIMEHSVLCGSRKYPVKEPFVELIKGSLNTFLNAFTYPDKTCYPVASANLQDFYNLIDVYLDAVFYPLITPYTLQQEGWHYELDAPDGAMSFKGVVFNEMKGAYSDPDSVLAESSQHALFPDNTYHLDSGGDPAAIPNLTYEQFKAFHAAYYHPSNARIFFYGDDDPDRRLKLVDDFLAGFDSRPVDSTIPLQARFSQPVRQVVAYESGEEDPGKAMVTVNWLLPETGQAEISLGLGVLEEILIGSPAAPLRKALIDSGLGEDLAGSGLVPELRQMFFSTGLKGLGEQSDADKVEALILATLEKLAQEGIDPDAVAAAMNTVEFVLRENNTGRFPRGLSLMLRALQTWLHDQDPLVPLAFEAPLNAIKARLAGGERYFEALIREHFLANQHRATVVLLPDPQVGKRRAAAEQARLDAARTAMDAAALQGVVENTAELKRRQAAPDSPEALASIPMLQLKDLDRQSTTIPLEVSALDGAQVLYHDLFTNGIAYLDLGFNLHGLPAESLPYIPLFGRALLETGTATEDFVQLVQHIGRSTGGIHPTLFTSARMNSTRGEAYLFLRAKAMLPQVGEMLGILGDVLTTARLNDRERFRQMVLEEKAGLEASLVGMGHRYVAQRLSASFSEASWAAEQMGGVSHLFFLRDLINRIENDWDGVVSVLEGIRAALLNRAGVVANVTVDGAGWKAVQPQLTAFLHSLPTAVLLKQDWPQPQGLQSEALTLPSQVNFVGKADNIYSRGYRLDGSAMVIAHYLTSTWMWEKVRVQGGAYGGFLNFDRFSGVLAYLSYRDPNLEATLQTYDRTEGFLRNLELPAEELARAIIGTIGDIDAYQLPDAKGYTSLARHLLGVTDEERQRLRDEVLSTTPADFRAFADVLAAVKDHGRVAALASPDATSAVKTLKWDKVTRLL